MNATDRIRILWIDDREEMDGYPEAHLPQEFDEWFEIVHHSPSKLPMSYRSAKEFMPCLQKFWFGKNRDILPAEIIATDYNLAKRAGLTVLDQTDEEIDRDLLGDDIAESAGSASTSAGSTRSVNFEGLLISLFYGTLTYRHPSAIVPMTRYLSEMPYEVETLHALVEPFLGVDFQYIGLEDRKWVSIAKEGVKHLRRRIEKLYEAGDIVVSPSDLMMLTESARHAVLTVRSPFATRRMPVQGLFVDVPEAERDKKIQDWAKSLLALVGCEDLTQAQELAAMVWGAYNNNQLIEDRKNLSLLYASRADGKDVDEAELERLNQLFGVEGKKCKANCVDITSGDYSDRVRRWAALLVILNLLKRLIQIKNCVEKHVSRATGMSINNPDGPVLTVDDLYLALFPAPRSPLIVPWHEGKYIDKSSGWVKALTRWKDRETGENLSLHVPDVLAGEGWLPKGPHGLRASERLILQGFALDDDELTESDWLSYSPSLRVLYGKREVGK